MSTGRQPKDSRVVRRTSGLVAAAFTCLLAGSAAAIPYPVDVRVDDEADLDQAFYDGDLTEDERDRLRELFRHPVDVNTADRDALYDLPGITWEMADAILAARGAAGRFGGVEDLATVPGVPRDVYDQVLPYVRARPVAEVRNWSAELELGGIWRTEIEHPDHALPGFTLEGSVDFLRHGSSGFLLALRPRIGRVHDAGSDGSMSAKGTALRMDPAAFWVAWDAPRWSVIAGTYRLGFGQRLTLDNSRRQRPHGWTVADDAVWDLGSGTVTPQTGFHGVALRAKQIDLPVGWLDLTVFGSAWPKDLYYTDVAYDHPKGTPFLAEAGTIDPDSGKPRSIQYATLPYVMWEAMGGANLGWWRDDQNAVGVTGYVAWLHFDPKAPNLRLSPSSPYPERRTLFGAAGVDFRVGRGIFDLAGEGTVTDRGSPAAVLRARVTPVAGLEILPSFRYFSPGYDNPYARTEADADEYLGSRARDELGGRLQVLYQPHPMVRLRADLDVWHHQYPNTSCDPTITDPDDPLACPTGDNALPIRPSTDLEALFRLQVAPTRFEHFAIWATYNDRDLGRSGRRLSYSSYTSGGLDYSGGSKVSWALSGGTSRIPRTSVSFMVRQVFEDVHALSTQFDQTWYAWLRVATNLAPGPTLALRVKFYDGSTVADPDRASGQRCDSEVGSAALTGTPLPGTCRGETYVEATLGASQRFTMGPGRSVVLRIRTAWTRWLDHRSKWSPGSLTASRDEIGLQGSLGFQF